MNIAITGEGIVSAIGNDKQQVLKSLMTGKSGIGEMKYLQSIHHELPVGECPPLATLAFTLSLAICGVFTLI